MQIGRVYEAAQLRQFFEDWCHELDANYQIEKKPFTVSGPALAVSGFSEASGIGPSLVLENGGQTVVLGEHTHGYVGGGSSYGGSSYRRVRTPGELVLVVSTSYRARWARLDTADPAALVGLYEGNAACRRHPHCSTAAGWEVLLPEEANSDSDGRGLRYDRYIMTVAFRLSPAQVWEFVVSLPCTCPPPVSA